MENIIKLDNVEAYNRMFGLKDGHPLISIIDLKEATRFPTHVAMNYGVYALFLKQTRCGDIRYGRQNYDYQEGTVTSFAPGQVVEVQMEERPQAQGLLFHPDLIRGTALGREIRHYSFFSYNSNEALHLSETEKSIFIDCLDKIRMEVERPADRHSKRLIVRNIELLLDYCMRFYERQFITRGHVNRDVLTGFERLLNDYFADDRPQRDGVPTVRWCAEQLHLSANYFGDLVKKETGKSAQEYIQLKVIEIAKERIFEPGRSISEVAYGLGFRYPQHFTRLFKKVVGCSPNEYRSVH